MRVPTRGDDVDPLSVAVGFPSSWTLPLREKEKRIKKLEFVDKFIDYSENSWTDYENLASHEAKDFRRK